MDISITSAPYLRQRVSIIHFTVLFVIAFSAFHSIRSRIFHPYPLVPRFPPLHFWRCRVFRSRIFSRRVETTACQSFFLRFLRHRVCICCSTRLIGPTELMRRLRFSLNWWCTGDSCISSVQRKLKSSHHFYRAYQPRSIGFGDSTPWFDIDKEHWIRTETYLSSLS